MTRGQPQLTLSGTWTLDPLVPVVEFWLGLLQLDAGIRVAPYAQLFQQLLDPASAFRRNRHGANIVCLRWEDLVPQAGDDGSLVIARVDELASALSAFEHEVPCLVLAGPELAGPVLAGPVLAGPSGDGTPAWREATGLLASKLAGTANITVRDGADAMARYRVGQVHDAAADRFGHVPYTPQALAALGTTIARWHAAAVRPPVKLFAVDGDHTLWSGVVGEAGVDGLRIEEGHARLQRELVAQGRAGRLLCLLSKNEEADARAVFERRADMALGWDDFVAHRVDWNPKPDNLRDMVTGLGLGLDSVVFLDDNPVECAQMRSGSPATLTVRVPGDPGLLKDFVEHLWLFDRHIVTDEDRKRTDLYRQNAARAELQRDAGSLQSFLDGLELVVDIDPPQAADVPRLAQLTQRTNQFNASLLRLHGGDVLVAGDDVLHRAVRARDRFGDYGLVGQLRARSAGGRLEVDLFMLSCRALGRGIEHRMLAAAGAHAQSLGLEEVLVRFSAGERNTPVRRFLEAIPGATFDGRLQGFVLSAARAAAFSFDAADVAQPPPEGDDPPAAAAPAADTLANTLANTAADPGAVYERIAHELTTAADIERAVAACRQPRPELAVGYIAPAPGMEREIATIWEQALRIDAVGAHDPFSELGGKSIQLVQVHRLLLERLGIDVEITTLFQHPTVASLAAQLSSARSGSAGLEAAHVRGRNVREAQARAAAARRRSIASARTRTGA